MSNATNSPALSRVEGLLDENSFVEIMSEVTSRSTDFNLTNDETPGDGVVIGHGLIDGNLVFVYSQDSSVLGGTVGEKHAEKIRKVYEDAVNYGAPVIGIIDCGGVRLQESYDALNSLGNVIQAAAKTSGVVPVVSCVVGNCGGGMNVVAGVSDFVFMTKQASLFVNSPDALPGNKNVDTSAPEFQSKEVGLADVFENETELFNKVRELIAIIPANNMEGGRVDDCDDDLNRASANVSKDSSIEDISKSISDDENVIILRSSYAKDMTTGFIRLNGMTVGFIGNSDYDEYSLSSNGLNKASDFVKFLDSYEIPLLTLSNVKGYRRSIEEEKTISKAISSFTVALANADIPKINLITGNAFGSAALLMNSKSMGADLVFALSDSDMGIMDATKAAKIICPDGSVEDQKNAADKFSNVQSGTINAARRGLVDRIVNGIDVRKYLIDGFEFLYTKKENESLKKHSTK